MFDYINNSLDYSSGVIPKGLINMGSVLIDKDIKNKYQDVFFNVSEIFDLKLSNDGKVYNFVSFKNNKSGPGIEVQEKISPAGDKVTQQKKKKVNQIFSGFDKFDINHVNYDITHKVKKIATGLELAFISQVANKILSWNKSFDYISLSQLEEDLSLSRPKVISLSKSVHEKRIILSYLDNTKKGYEKRYYFLNTPVYSLIVKALEKDLFTMQDLIKFDSKFKKQLSRIKYQCEDTKNANADILYSNFRVKRDKEYLELSLKIQSDLDILDKGGSKQNLLGGYFSFTRVVNEIDWGSKPDLPTTDIIYTDNINSDKQQQTDKVLEEKESKIQNLKNQVEPGKKNVVVVSSEELKNKEYILESTELEEAEKAYLDSLKNLDYPEKEELKEVGPDLLVNSSEKTGSLNQNEISEGTIEEENIPSVGAGACEQVVDRFKSIVDHAMTVQYSIDGKLTQINLLRNLIEKALKTGLEMGNYKNLDDMENSVKSQVEAFRYQVGLKEKQLGGTFSNCLKENRALPEAYIKHLQEQKDLQDEIEYLPILEAWQGYPTSKKNIKKNLMALLSRDICSLKDQEKNPSYEKIKSDFKEKVKRVSLYCDFSTLINSFSSSSKQRCFDVLNEII